MTGTTVWWTNATLHCSVCTYCVRDKGAVMLILVMTFAPSHDWYLRSVSLCKGLHAFMGCLCMLDAPAIMLLLQIRLQIPGGLNTAFPLYLHLEPSTFCHSLLQYRLPYIFLKL